MERLDLTEEKDGLKSSFLSYTLFYSKDICEFCSLYHAESILHAIHDRIRNDKSPARADGRKDEAFPVIVLELVAVQRCLYDHITISKVGIRLLPSENLHCVSVCLFVENTSSYIFLFLL